MKKKKIFSEYTTYKFYLCNIGSAFYLNCLTGCPKEKNNKDFSLPRFNGRFITSMIPCRVLLECYTPYSANFNASNIHVKKYFKVHK